MKIICWLLGKHRLAIFRVGVGEGFQPDVETYCHRCNLAGLWKYDPKTNKYILTFRY